MQWQKNVKSGPMRFDITTKSGDKSELSRKCGLGSIKIEKLSY